MNNNFQRKNSISNTHVGKDFENTHVGKDFEDIAFQFFRKQIKGLRKKYYNEKKQETLCQYYLRTHAHVIPADVEFWELDEESGEIKRRMEN